MSLTVCQTKKHYDSEFEAEVAAAKLEDRFGEEMVPYRCGEHWHLTHKDRSLSRGAGNTYDRCDDCGEIVKESKMYKHKCKGARHEYRSRKTRKFSQDSY